MCATVNEEGRKKLDAYIREKETLFPLSESVYEYYVDVRNKCFSPWEEKLTESWKFEPE